MEMKRTAIKALIQSGAAEDITREPGEVYRKGLEKIALSFGVNGMNGGLFQEVKTGKLYAITARNGNLFKYA